MWHPPLPCGNAPLPQGSLGCLNREEPCRIRACAAQSALRTGRSPSSATGGSGQAADPAPMARRRCGASRGHRGPVGRAGRWRSQGRSRRGGQHGRMISGSAFASTTDRQHGAARAGRCHAASGLVRAPATQAGRGTKNRHRGWPRRPAPPGGEEALRREIGVGGPLALLHKPFAYASWPRRFPASPSPRDARKPRPPAFWPLAPAGCTKSTQRLHLDVKINLMG